MNTEENDSNIHYLVIYQFPIPENVEYYEEGKYKTRQHKEFVYHYRFDNEQMRERRVDGWVINKIIRLTEEIGSLINNISIEAEDTTIQLNKKAKDINLTQNIRELGQFIYNHLLTEDISIRLSELKDKPSSYLLIESADAITPWELLHDKYDFLCTKYYIGRVRSISDREELEYKGNLKVLLMANSRGDLEESENETNKISEIIRQINESQDLTIDVKICNKEKATKDLLFGTLMEKSEYQIIHFAGHAVFDSDFPENSKLSLYDGFSLKAYELKGINDSPIVFVNACDSSLMDDSKGYFVGFGLANGLAPSFIRGGAAAYIGSIWPVFDESASQFSSLFYKKFLYGEDIGKALTEARKALKEKSDSNDITWASYVLFGNPQLSLKSQLIDSKGELVDIDGVLMIYNLEEEYSALEYLSLNDQPWILWSHDDYLKWIDKVNTSDEKKYRMINIFNNYIKHFQRLTEKGEKKYIIIGSLKNLRKEIKEKDDAWKQSFINRVKHFSTCPDFLYFLYEPDDGEVPEIEIVSKNKDPAINLKETMYVPNKDSKYEKDINYIYYREFDEKLILKKLNEFSSLKDNVTKQYNTKYREYYPSNEQNFQKLDNKEINDITIKIIETMIGAN